MASANHTSKYYSPANMNELLEAYDDANECLGEINNAYENMIRAIASDEQWLEYLAARKTLNEELDRKHDSLRRRPEGH